GDNVKSQMQGDKDNDSGFRKNGSFAPSHAEILTKISSLATKELLAIKNHFFHYPFLESVKEIQRGFRAALSVVMRAIIRFNAVVMLLLVGFFCIYPVVRASLDIRDPALRRPGTPKFAWRLFRNMTPRYAKWAQERLAKGQAESLSTSDISGTEWPL